MRVFITGMGALSSLGNSTDALFQGLLEDRSGVKHYPEWEKYAGLHCHLGAPVPTYDEKVIPRTARRSMSRMSEMAVLAAKEALTQAKLDVQVNSRRSCLIMGSTTGSPETLEAYFKKLIERGGPEGQLSTSFFKAMNHSVAANVAVGLSLTIPLLSPSSACSTSSQALALGWELIRSGMYDVVIAGGADELHYTSVAVFDIVFAASRKFNHRPNEAPRPFDKERDGLVVSEGASVLVLESEEHARRREAKVLAELTAGSYLCDGTHMSQPQKASMLETMQMALDRGKLKASEVDYVNAHATATQIGDIEEARAIQELFGSHTPVSSLKGHLGHSLAACGGLEIIASVKMLERNLLIPTRNLKEVDPECSHIQVFKEKTEKPLRHILSNNFAFGGMNTSLLVSKPN